MRRRQVVKPSFGRAFALCLGAQVYPPDRFWDEMKKRGWNATSGGLRTSAGDEGSSSSFSFPQ